MHRTSSTRQVVRCPRCGYEQAGIVSSWETTCPLDGTCSECGLAFRWAEVLLPEKFEPRWCIEFVPRWHVPMAGARTFLRSFWPWRFWSRLRMSLRIRWRRLAAYVVMLLLPLLLGYVTVQTTVAIRVRHDTETSLNGLRPMLIAQPQRFMGATAGARPAAVQRRQQQMQAFLNMKQLVNHSYVAAVLEAVFLPWAGTSSGTATSPWGPSPYPAPRILHSNLSRSPNDGGLVERYSGLLAGVASSLWLSLLLPIGFVLLPVSRQRAKVRWGHIWRVTAYGLHAPVAMVTLAMLLISLGYAIDSWAFRINVVVNALGTVVIGLMVVWWAVAVKRYLRMPHAWAVASLLALVSLLLLVSVAYFVLPHSVLA